MKAFYCDHFVLPLPAGHRFPMQKYALLRQRIETEAIAADIQLIEPDPASDEDLLRVHDEDYVRRVVAGELTEAEQRRIGFPWTPNMVERSRRSVGGTMSALAAALENGAAVNLAGGTHHAHADRGRGFCVFNDAMVASRWARHHRLLEQVLIIDLDVHHGDGTASLAANDTHIYTMSIYGEKNYPAIKPPGDLDCPLPDDTDDRDYLDALDGCLNQALDTFQPDAVIYLAGADPYSEDRLGRLSLSKAGLAARDRMVFERVSAHNLPIAVCMAGGYAEDVADIVDIHFQTVCTAMEYAALHV